MKKLKTIAVIFFIFILGVLIGIFVNSLYIREKISHRYKKSPSAIVLEQINSRITLTNEQRAHIESSGKAMDEEMREFHRRHRPEAEAIIERGVQRMKNVLDAGQQRELDAILEETKQRHRARWDRKDRK